LESTNSLRGVFDPILAARISRFIRSLPLIWSS
jgi:hypothetical protein